MYLTRKLYRDIFDHMRLSQPSAKSMANLIEQLKKSTGVCQIMLSKAVVATIDTTWKCLHVPL